MEKKEEEQEEKENASGENVQQPPQPQPAPPPDAELGDPLTCEEYLSIIIGENIAEPLSGAIGEFADGFQRKSEKTTLPSIIGSAAGGFVMGGACGMIEDAADVITHLPEVLDGMGNAIKNTFSDPKGTAAGIGNDIKEYFNETWINGNPNDWAWEGGKIGFDVALTVVTGGMEAGAETGAKATVGLAKEGMEEAAEAGIKQGAIKQGKEILENAVEKGVGIFIQEGDKKGVVEIVEDVARKIEEENAKNPKKSGKVKIHKNKPAYLDQVDAIIALMEKDGVSKNCTFQFLYDKYSQKGGMYDYTKKEIAGAYYKYTGKMDDHLDEIEYDRILKDVGDPVCQDNVAEDEVKNHAHHICYKRGNGQEQQKWVGKGHKILRKYEIDPVLDPHNLVPAPNTGHSLKEIREVVTDLEKTEETALDNCKKNGIEGKEKKLYVKNKLYVSLKKSGKKAKEKNPKKKGKKKNAKKQQTNGKS